MRFSEFQDKIAKIKDRYNKEVKPVLEELREEYRQFIGLDVIIPFGTYRGRRGQITYVNRDKDRVQGIIQPYKKNTNGEYTKELLWDRVDARTYWDLSKVGEIFIKGYKNE